MVNAVLKFFCSLRLTVVLLTLGMFLIFFGTLAEVDVDLYHVQTGYFRSFFVQWTPRGTDWHIPVYPGGYLLGGMLLINLMAAHIKRFKLSWSKLGIFLTHSGVILLLLGQLSTDLLSVESFMRLREGDVRNYSESSREDELAIINKAHPDYDEVLSVPGALLDSDRHYSDPRIPFTIQVKQYFANSSVTETKNSGRPAAATEGIGSRLSVESAPPVTVMDQRNVPSAVIELKQGANPVGTYLVSEWLTDAQEIHLGNQEFKLALRPTRYYKPFSLQLLRFHHDKYIGTDIPKNFAADVQLISPVTKENRRVRIYMNNPLRYGGETFYQAGFDKDPKVTILQVVRNPGWLTPYVAVLLVGGGMLWQFLGHLSRFFRRSRAAAASELKPVAVASKRKRPA